MPQTLQHYISTNIQSSQVVRRRKMCTCYRTMRHSSTYCWCLRICRPSRGHSLLDFYLELNLCKYKQKTSQRALKKKKSIFFKVLLLLRPSKNCRPSRGHPLPLFYSVVNLSNYKQKTSRSPLKKKKSVFPKVLLSVLPSKNCLKIHYYKFRRVNKKLKVYLVINLGNYNQKTSQRPLKKNKKSVFPQALLFVLPPKNCMKINSQWNYCTLRKVNKKLESVDPDLKHLVTLVSSKNLNDLRVLKSPLRKDPLKTKLHHRPFKFPKVKYLCEAFISGTKLNCSSIKLNYSEKYQSNEALVVKYLRKFIFWLIPSRQTLKKTQLLNLDKSLNFPNLQDLVEFSATPLNQSEKEHKVKYLLKKLSSDKPPSTFTSVKLFWLNPSRKIQKETQILNPGRYQSEGGLKVKDLLKKPSGYKSPPDFPPVKLLCLNSSRTPKETQLLNLGEALSSLNLQKLVELLRKLPTPLKYLTKALKFLLKKILHEENLMDRQKSLHLQHTLKQSTLKRASVVKTISLKDGLIPLNLPQKKESSFRKATQNLKELRKARNILEMLEKSSWDNETVLDKPEEVKTALNHRSILKKSSTVYKTPKKKLVQFKNAAVRNMRKKKIFLFSRRVLEDQEKILVYINLQQPLKKISTVEIILQERHEKLVRGQQIPEKYFVGSKTQMEDLEKILEPLNLQNLLKKTSINSRMPEEKITELKNSIFTQQALKKTKLTELKNPEDILRPINLQYVLKKKFPINSENLKNLQSRKTQYVLNKKSTINLRHSETQPEFFKMSTCTELQLEKLPQKSAHFQHQLKKSSRVEHNIKALNIQSDSETQRELKTSSSVNPLKKSEILSKKCSSLNQVLRIIFFFLTAFCLSSVHGEVLSNVIDEKEHPVKNEVHSLVHRWAPLILLAPGERFMPSAVPYFLQHTVPAEPHNQTILLQKDLPAGRSSEQFYLFTRKPIESLLMNSSSFLYGQNPEKEPVPVYAYIKRCSTSRHHKWFTNSMQKLSKNATAKPDPFSKRRIFQVTYWLFYPYNEGKHICTLSLGFLGPVPIPKMFNKCLGEQKYIGSHVGDWEHMTLFFTNDKTPLKMYVSTHDAGVYYSYDPENNLFVYEHQESRNGILMKPKFPSNVYLINGHPLLYSAKGSHGLWSKPGAHRFLTVPRLYDYTGNGVAWKTWNSLEIIDPPFTNVPQWMKYRGKWGNMKHTCHPLKKLGIDICQLSDGPTGIPMKRLNFVCPKIKPIKF